MYAEINPILPNTSELVLGLISFLLLFAFLYKKVFPSINRVLQDRADTIKSDLERAEAAREEARQLLADYREQLKGARDEARQVVEEAKQAAESMRKELVVKAEREAHQVLERAEQEISAQRDRAFNSLRREVGELAVEVAGKIVGDSLDKDRHLRLVDDYIDELNGSEGGAGGSG